MSSLTRIEIGITCTDLDRAATFWSQALHYAIGDLDRAGVYLDLIPPDPHLPVVFLQLIREQSPRPSHTHIDLYVELAQDEVRRLEALGAARVGAPRTGTEGGWWHVMTDPDGNEFCVCQAT